MTAADRKAYDEAAGQRAKGNGHAGAEPLPIWTLASIRKLPPPSWIVPGLIPAKAKTLIFGPSGSFKSTSAVTLACAIAHGHDIAGIAPDLTVPSLIVAAEDAEGLAATVLAWHDAHGLEHGDVAVAPADGLTLAAPEAAARIIASADLAFPRRPYGIVLDHWDLLAGGDLNDANAIQPALATLDALIAHRGQYTIMLAHTPWDNPDRMKGSVLTWNNHGTRLRAEAQPGTLASTLRVVHHKRGRSGLCISFTWQETDEGIAAANIKAENAGPPKKGPSGANQRLALDCLHRAVAEHVEPHPGHVDIPVHAKLARFDRVQDLYARIATGDEPWRKRQRFERAIATMQARHLVRHVEGYLWA